MDGEVRLQVPPVGITELDVSISDADQEITIEPQLLTQNPEMGDAGDDPGNENQPQQVSRVRASLGSTESIVVRWHPETGQQPDMDLLSRVTKSPTSVDRGRRRSYGRLFDIFRVAWRTRQCADRAFRSHIAFSTSARVHDSETGPLRKQMINRL